MIVKQAVSYSEALGNLKAMIDTVVADRAPLAITRQRSEGAVLIAENEWVAIEETLYLRRCRPMRSDCRKASRSDAGKGGGHEQIQP